VFATRPTRRHDPRLDELASISLFRGCPEGELAAVARMTTPADVAPGRVLCQHGTRGHEAFVIVAGEAVATISGTEIARLGPGSFAGEMALLDGGPRTATVTAATPMTLLVATEPEFRQLLVDAPTVARRMLVALSGRLRLAQRFSGS
jgi:CRP-like cAMP-binding protein